MNIKDLISQQSINEGPIGSAVGAGLGALAGGPLGAAAGGAIGNWAGDKMAGLGSKLKGALQRPKAGGNVPPSPQTAATTGATSGNEAGATDPNTIRQLIAQKKAEIAELQKQLGAPKVEPGIGQQQGKVAAVAGNTPEPGATAPETEPAVEPPVEPGIGNQQNSVNAIAGNTPDPSAVRQQKQAAAAKVAQDQMAANPTPSSAQPAAPTPADIRAQKQAGAAKVAQDQMAANATAPAATTAPVATNKPTPDQIKQAQLKKDLLKRQQARTAGQTQPSGYTASGVGDPRQRVYTGAGGAPKSYTVRESVGFYSKFLGQDI